MNVGMRLGVGKQQTESRVQRSEDGSRGTSISTEQRGGRREQSEQSGERSG